jgi:hypothetical protein
VPDFEGAVQLQFTGAAQILAVQEKHHPEGKWGDL